MEIKPFILLVEDEEAISTMLQYNLEQVGYEVDVVADGEDALYQIEERIPDLIILDWMLPSMSGVEICRSLRSQEETQSIPVIMLTARGEEADRVRGLDSGADDYMIKPFSPKELIARINAVFRRTRPLMTSRQVEYGGVSIDLDTYKASFAGKNIRLGPTEFRLLLFLMENPRKVYTRDQLLDAVWGRDVYVENRTVDVHIRRLRKALGEAKEGLDDMVRTVRSAGYMLDVDSD